MKNKFNRNSIILISVLFTGILLIGILKYFTETETLTPQRPKPKTAQKETVYDELSVKLETLKSGVFKPAEFDILEGSIEGSLASGSITQKAADYLNEKKNEILANRIYQQCDIFLINDRGNSSQILTWLNELQKKNGAKSKIENYRKQIYWHQYYSVTLPNKVNGFIQPGITNYVKKTYLSLMNEVETMPGLDNRYKNTSKFSKIRTKLKRDLYQFDFDAN